MDPDAKPRLRTNLTNIWRTCFLLLYTWFHGNADNDTVRQVFRNEQRYYELLVNKSVTNLSLFPYHLADIITKGLRVTPFNYYVDVLCYLLKNDRSYDTLPNFTAADCTYTHHFHFIEWFVVVQKLTRLK